MKKITKKQLDEAIKTLKIKADFRLNSKLTHNTIKNHFTKIMKHFDKHECVMCGNKGYHNNKKLNLQMDHTNGIKKDQDFWNLRYLCPNCHSQTETFAGGNRKNIRVKRQAWPTRKEKKKMEILLIVLVLGFIHSFTKYFDDPLDWEGTAFSVERFKMKAFS